MLLVPARETVTFWLAIYASILATWNSVLSYFRDRQRVTISFARETEYIEEGEYRGVGETYTVVKVLNKGRRPVTITEVRARLKRGWVTLRCNPPVPKELTDDQYITAVAGDEELDLSDVAAFEAHRAIGRPYSKMVAPWFTRIRWRLKAKRKKTKFRI
jgi:hypothetical protein